MIRICSYVYHADHYCDFFKKKMDYQKVNLGWLLDSSMSISDSRIQGLDTISVC